MEEPDEGTIRPDPNVRLSYLPQDPVFPGEHTVLEQVLLGLEGEDRALAEYEAKTILNQLGVSRFDQKVGQLSGGERRRVALAAELLERGGDALRQFRFTLGDAASLGMVCGGGVTVQFQYLPAGEQRIIAVLRDLIEADGGNRDTWLLRRIEGEQVTAMGLADRTGPRHLDILPEELELLCGNQAVFARKWLSIPVVKAGRTYLFGGGHVSQALVPVLASLGFRPVVYDDRPEFADPALFPGAERTLCGDFTRLTEQVTVTPEDYVVVMTRGHQADYEVLAQVLRSGARYLGCIGSRRKLALCRDRLLEAGFTEAEYSRLHAPIGLAIGAQTPAEIAVSVAAEMIAVRAGLDPRR